MRAFVVPGLVAVTGFHRRDDMHQAGMVATDGKDLADDYTCGGLGRPTAIAARPARVR